MSVSKRNLFIFGAIGSAAVSAFSFQAIADSLPVATFTAATTVNSIKVDGGPGSASTHFSSATDFGQGTISSLPFPTMSATAQESTTNTVTVGLSMSYYFEFVGPVTEVLPSQPIFISSLGQGQAVFLQLSINLSAEVEGLYPIVLAPLVPAAVVHWALHSLR